MRFIAKYLLTICSCVFSQIPLGARAQGIITTIAGNGITQYIGDGWPATNYSLAYPAGIAIDREGNVYSTDFSTSRIRRTTIGDTLSTICGNGTAGYAGDNGPATAATAYLPYGLCLDTAGNIFFSDEHSHVVRRISRATGIITTVAGNGTAGFSGDGGPATDAQLAQPQGICVDIYGNIYIADKANLRIRKVDALTGAISTYAGNGINGYSGDGGPATDTRLSFPRGVAVDLAGNVYIADYSNSRIRKVSATGIISTIAGRGTMGYSGDNGLATDAELTNPMDVCVSIHGIVYIADWGNNVIRSVTTDGIIHTVAGTGANGYTGDGGPATAATFFGVTTMCVDTLENIYIADGDNSAIRKVTAIYDGVGYVKQAELHVFPNPASSMLHIGMPSSSGATQLELFDVTGKPIYSMTVVGGEGLVDVAGYAAGVYVLRATSATGSSLCRIAVVH